MLLAVHVNLGSRILAEKHAIVDFDVEWGNFAVVVRLAFADCDDLYLLRFLFRCVWNNDPSLDLFLLIDPLNYDPILQRSNLHL
jgi:hypothetical protein